MDQVYIAFALAVLNANGAYVAAEFKQPSVSNVQQFTEGKLETYHSPQPSYDQKWISNAAYGINLASYHDLTIQEQQRVVTAVTGLMHA